jgi:nucleoside phosphorylase
MVILAGIAAGFPESGIALGDIVVPFSIVPYELAKIREVGKDNVTVSPSLFRASDMSMTGYEHRGSPLDVSHPLWVAAEAISRDPMRPWLNKVSAQRPLSSKGFPTVHVDRRFKLGSGDKLVASEFAEARQWLISTYGKDAIGLEMEAFGSIIACRSSDTPFLVIKASQDPATAAKDHLGEKDVWRIYAAEGAAAFALTLIENYDLPQRVPEQGGSWPTADSSCFLPAGDRFHSLVERNFLFDFDHSGNPDYLGLISSDFRNLFFHFWMSSQSICVTGPEGCGKTFSALLLADQLKREGYDAFYVSVREAELNRTTLSNFMRGPSKRAVFIDDCQDDLEKTRDLLEAIQRSGRQLEEFKAVFLARPLEPAEHIETFGQNLPTIHFREDFNDLPHLAQLFFIKIGRPQDIRQFEEELSRETLSRELWSYRNMEFWNTYFNTVAHAAHFTFDRGVFYTHAYSYLRAREPLLVSRSSALTRFLPFFANGLPILREWAVRNLPVTEDQIAELVSLGLIQERVLNWDNLHWENDTAGFICQNIHPTKARIGIVVGTKYGVLDDSEVKMLTEYARAQLQNMYYIVSTLSHISLSLLKLLYTSQDFQAVLRSYLVQRHLGKHLDRVLSKIARIDNAAARALVDSTVKDAFVAKLNDDRPFLITKALLLRALHRIDPLLALDVFKRLNINSMASAFVTGKRGARLNALSKLIETLKNLYYAADGVEKGEVFAAIENMLVECSPRIIIELDREGFGEFHWLLKRLDPIRWPRGSVASVAYKVLSSISPPQLTMWICMKDVRINELRFIFKLGRRLQLSSEFGGQMLYPDYFSSHLSADCLRNIFNSPRSKLYDIAITSRFNHEILARPLLSYAQDGGLVSKVKEETSLVRINGSVSLLAGDVPGSLPIQGLSDMEVRFLIRTIIDNTVINHRIISSTLRDARLIGKPINIDEVIERFNAFSTKYGSTWGRREFNRTPRHR